MSQQLVWLITGTTSGLGKQLALEVLSRGDKVIATGRARSLDKLDELKDNGADILQLDVTAPYEKIEEVAKAAIAIHGRIDVLVNNAGYVLVGTFEENTPKEVFDQFNTNVFGGLNVARAFLPYMREKKSGTIVWSGSLAGWVSHPYAGSYAASKMALRGISISLHDEISALGLRSICIEYGTFRTAFLQPSQRGGSVSRIADYNAISGKMEKLFTGLNGKQLGDPTKAAKAVADVVRGEGAAAGRPFPLTLAVGSDTYRTVQNAVERANADNEAWKDVSFSTDIKE